MESSKQVVLLVAEAVTLAHYGRIATLARALASSDYHVIVAADPRYRAMDEIPGADFHPIWSIPSSRFSLALERGAPLYDVKTLLRYVEEDMALIDAVKPDLIIGDFRLSLAVSAPLRKVSYASVVNAYWSPHADIAYPVPELPFTRITGLRVGQALFDLVRPLAFALHARPLNHVRRRYGLASLGTDLRKTYTWADYTLYADIPEWVKTGPLPGNHRFLGPVLWSTHTSLPDWWDSLPPEKPIVFVTLGSSGQADLLPSLFEALSKWPVTVIAATAGRVELKSVPSNVYAVDYLPVDAASARSAFVISNGGSLTTYQALASGVPVIGLCSNMDQLLNMNAAARLGAGIALRARNLSAASLLEAATAMRNNPSYAQAAKRIGKTLPQMDTGQRFRDIVAEILRQGGDSAPGQGRD